MSSLSKSNRRWLVGVTLALTLAGFGGFASQTMAQDDGGGRGGRGGFGQREMTDEQREEFRKRMQERMEEMRANQRKQLQEELAVNDEEFAVLHPMVEKVQQYQREKLQLSRSFGGQGGPGGRGQGGGRGGFDPAAFGIEMPALSSEGEQLKKAMDSLKAGVDDKATTAETLSERVAAVRAARAKLNAATSAAQAELRSVLVARQEAALVISGVLE